MNKIKRTIIILLVGIVMIIGIIMILKISAKQNGENNQKDNVEEWEEGKIFEDNENGFQKLEDPNIFYSITNALSNYLSALYYDAQDIQNNQYNIQNQEEQRSIIFKLLDKEYIRKNNIKEENVENYIDDIQNDYQLIPLDIRVRYNQNIITYILNVYLEDSSTLQLENKFYIIRIDTNNASFSVEPILEKINDIDKISVENNSDEITLNDYNQYEIITISVERLVKIYMDQFTNMMINHTDITYDRYLNEEYKEARFGTKEQFREYVEKNREEMQQVRATKYLIESNEEGTNYIILDQYQNTYEFYETSTMLYTVKLDTYTIPTENFKTKYQEANEQNRVMININKWIQMLNNRDYTNAYYVLDETYRNNIFGSEEKFEAIIKEKLPSHYKVEYGNFSKENENYLQNIILTDILQEEEENIQISIVMQLKEEIDFVMSFNWED